MVSNFNDILNKMSSEKQELQKKMNNTVEKIEDKETVVRQLY